MNRETVVFQNPGLIDPRCITTIGVSVKEGENPIGLFGTGLKYAIAIILRCGGEITIWRGFEPLKFTAKPVEIRGQQQQIVCMNGAELGFTTHLGNHWEVWQAMRELYCNTKDEGGESFAGEPVQIEGATTIAVDLPAFADSFRNIGNYILNGNPVASNAHAEFHRLEYSHAVFYRSIRVLDVLYDKPFLFSPNLVEQVQLTEDRTAKSQWDVKQSIARAVLKSDDMDFLVEYLTAGREYAEHELDLDWSHIAPSEAFLSAARGIAYDPSRTINKTLLNVLARLEEYKEPEEAALLETESAMLARSIEFCRALTYTVDEFPITVVESLGESILGRADIKKRSIYLARRAISMGDLTLAATLIEEWAHIKHGLIDCDRNMQNWLFEQITRLGAAYLEKGRHA